MKHQIDFMSNKAPPPYKGMSLSKSNKQKLKKLSQ